MPVDSLRAGPKPVSVPSYIWLAIFGVCAFWLLLGSGVVETSREHDFLNLYTGGALVRDGQLTEMHQVEVQLAKERELVPDIPQLIPFVRLPVYGLLLTPLSMLPFGTAFWVWLGFQSAMLLALWAWIAREVGGNGPLWAALFAPAALGVAHGQDCVFMAAVVLGVYVLLRRERDFAAGAVLGLGLIKFHLFLLWPLALIVQKRWRTMAGAAVTVAAELGISLLLAGPSGLRAYFALLLRDDLGQLMPSEERMLNIRSLLLNLGLDSMPLEGICIAAVVVLMVWTCWKAPLWRWLAAVSVASLLVVPHVYGYDATLLLVPAVLAYYRSERSFGKVAAGALLLPVPFLMPMYGSPWAIAAPAVVLLFFLGLVPWRLPRTSSPSLSESAR